jgi:integrase
MRRAAPGKTLLVILAGGGLGIGEALALRWQHVELGTGTLHVVDSKTAKGVREVHLTPALREELTLARADANDPKPADYVIATSTGRKHNPSNLRRDVLTPAVEKANTELEKGGIRRSAGSPSTACGERTRASAALAATTSATPPISSATKTPALRCASTRRRLSGATGSPART